MKCTLKSLKIPPEAKVVLSGLPIARKGPMLKNVANSVYGSLMISFLAIFTLDEKSDEKSPDL